MTSMRIFDNIPILAVKHREFQSWVERKALTVQCRRAQKWKLALVLPHKRAIDCKGFVPRVGNRSSFHY